MKVHRFSVTAFKALYFLCAASFGYWTLRNASWLPVEIGGSGSTEAYWTDYPYQHAPVEVKWYFCFNGGYHLTVLFYLLSESPFPDFWEDCLRVVIASFLICFSYISNYFRVGSIVLLVHDCCDLFTCACKVLVDTKYKSLTVALFLVLLLAWAYLRLWCYSKLVLYPLFQELPPVPCWGWFVFCLCTLLLLNIYWFSLMLKMLWHLIWSGQASDMHSRISESDLKNKYSSKSATGGGSTTAMMGRNTTVAAT